MLYEFAYMKRPEQVNHKQKQISNGRKMGQGQVGVTATRYKVPFWGDGNDSGDDCIPL